MDLKIYNITYTLEHKISENRRFLEAYSRLELIIGEIKMSVRNGRTYLRSTTWLLEKFLPELLLLQDWVFQI